MASAPFTTIRSHLAKRPTASGLALAFSILALGLGLFSTLSPRDKSGVIASSAPNQHPSAPIELDRLAALETAVEDLQRKLVQLQMTSASGQDRDRSASDGVTTDIAASTTEAPPALPVSPGDPPPTIVQQYFDEWGQSDWGETTATSIDTAALENPFFTRSGGDVITDCRQTVCRMEWFPGVMDDLPLQSREDVLAAARYEMLALAARNGTEVGQMATEWISDERGRVLAVTFERAPYPTR